MGKILLFLIAFVLGYLAFLGIIIFVGKIVFSFFNERVDRHKVVSLKKMKANAVVLVIDDELDICLMVTQYLQRLHFKTQYATTIQEACLKIRSMKFDLIFVDLTLPDGSGFESIRYTNQLALDPKIIVMSAHDNLATEAYALGVNLFITKPFTLKTLQVALQSLKFLSPDISSPISASTA